METLADRLKKAREEKGMNQTELAKKAHLKNQSIIGSLESGHRKSSSHIPAIAQALGVEALWLADGIGPKRVKKIEIDNESSFDYSNGAIYCRTIRISGEIQAGDNGFLNVQQFPEGIDEGYVLSPVNGNSCYALRVRGDSMHPRIKHGEIILINPDQDVRSGNEVVVNLKDGRQMVKVYLYERDGEVTLSSVNKSHEDVIVKLDDIDQMHYVAAILPRDSVLRRG